MNRWISVTLLLGAGLLLAPTPAEAQYLDPGAASVIVQVVIAGVVGVTAVLGLYWRRLRAWCSRKSSSKTPTNRRDS